MTITRIPTFPRLSNAVDATGNFTAELNQYLESLETISSEIDRAEVTYDSTLKNVLRSVVMIPGSGEFVYDTFPVSAAANGSAQVDIEDLNPGAIPPPLFDIYNTIAQQDYAEEIDDTFGEPASGEADFIPSVVQLKDRFPTLKNVSLVVSWFGDDLRCGECTIRPMQALRTVLGDGDWFVYHDGTDYVTEWQPLFGGKNATEIPAIATEPLSGDAYYGGTPCDQSVIRAIQHLKSEGLAVTFYPFILMHVLPENELPNPYGGSSQPVFPWRGRITCDPAPGESGTVDGTSGADAQVAAFLGTCEPDDFFAIEEVQSIGYSGPDEWSYRRMILHYAYLCSMAGGVDSFIIGTELRGLTWIRGAIGHPFVEGLKQLAAEVKAILPDAKVTYAADWSEFTPYQLPSSGGLAFHLDPLWSDENIDAIGIDNYWPISDWRGVTGLDEEEYANPYLMEYLLGYVEAGEGYDWYYASDAARIAQTRTDITDGAGKPWVFRYKDIKNWWLNKHYDRPGWVESGTPTDWVPQSKPIWFTEIGCPAVDKGTNQPNVFIDPKSSESFFPYFSTGDRDDLIQNRAIAAMHLYYDNSTTNPKSTVYSGRMVDPDRIYVYCWDARPYPWFPLSNYWGDSANWALGHWINGRQIEWETPDPDPEGEVVEFMPVVLMPKGGRAVNPGNGQLENPMQHYLGQIEEIAKRLRNIEIIAVREKNR